MDRTQLAPQKRAEAIHALLLEHLEQIEVDTALIETLRSQLADGGVCRDRVACSTLYALHRFASDGLVTVQLRGLAGLLGEVDVASATTVSDLKATVENQLGIPAHEQVLLRDGLWLKDAQILAQLCVSPLDRCITLMRVQAPKLYVIGGVTDGDAILDSGEVFDSAAGMWEPTPRLSTPRSNFVSAVIDGRLYVVGGSRTEDDHLVHLACAEVLEFVPADAEPGATQLLHRRLPKWRSLPPLSMPRLNCAAAVANGKLFVFGGDSGEEALDGGEMFDPATERWEALPSMRTARWHAACTVLEGKLYVIGGDNGHDAFACAEVFDTARRSWEALPDMKSRRFGLLSESLAGHVFAVGGFDGENNLNSAERFQPAATSWEELPSMWSARTRSVSAVFNGRLYVFGGVGDEQPISACEVYDPDVAGWLPLPAMESARYNASLTTAPDGRFYIAGGCDENALSSVEVFDIMTETWRTFPALPAPRSEAGVLVIDA